MSRARRIWKWTAATLAVVLGVLAVAVGAFRVWLEQSPRLGPDIVARIEKRSGLDLEFSRLDARLGLYGPELVFEDAVIRVPGERDALATAKAGRVGFDWWRFVRTGRLASGRVTLDGARLYVYVTDEGLELRGQGALFRDRDPNAPLRLDRLPMGRVAVTDSTLTVQDLRARGAPLALAEVEIDAERTRAALVVAGRARLPRELGERLQVAARLEGDLASLDRTPWSGTVTLRDAQLPGWAAFAPQWGTGPADGHGDVRAELRGVGPRVDRAATRVALADVKARAAPVVAAAPAATAPEAAASPPTAVAAASPPAPEPVAAPTPPEPRVALAPVPFRRLVADATVERLADGWRVSARNVDLDPGRDSAWRRGEVDVDVRHDAGRLTKLALRSPAIRLDALAPLATFLPPGEARDAFATLAPEGALTVVDLVLARGPRPGEWRLDGAARFTGLGIGAWRGIPGIRGLDGDVAASGDAGRVSVRSAGLRFELTRFLAGPVGANDVGATFDWWWRPDGWRIATDDVRVVAPAGRAGGKARLWLPSRADESPRLVLDLDVADVDAPAVIEYLPLRRFPPRTVQWLREGIRAGRVPKAKLEYAGATRRFPFRDGGGLFRVRADFAGIRLHYQDGWADLEGAGGEVEFRNEGFTARATAGRVAGLALERAAARMTDYRDAHLVIEAATRGDARSALAYVQSSPVGPRLGEFFMGVRGSGPFAADVRLDFPFRRFPDRVIEVRASFDRARAQLPGIDDELRDLVGSFVLVNRDVEVPLVTGTFLGGPFRAKASTVDGARGERVIVADASGRALAPRLQPQFRITNGSWLQGEFDWRAQGRIPRLEWRPEPAPLPADAPPDAEPQPRETEVRWLPATIRADTTLVGTALAFPAPFAKAADEARPLRADVTWDWGLEAGAPVPPKQLRARDTVRPAGVLLRAQVGRDSAALEWRREPGWTFRRGTLRFGGGAPALRDARGLWLEGSLAAFDLSAWLRVRLTATAPAVAAARAPGAPAAAAAPERASGLGAYLRGGTVAVDRFAVLGYAFPSVTVALEGRDDAWRAQVDGPAAKGAIVVPWQLPDGPPLVLDMDRLVLDARTPAPAASGADEPPLPPTQLPALQIDVRSLEIYKRRFGSLQARIVRVPQGLKLERGVLKGASFDATGTGDWLVGLRGEETRVALATTTTDVLDTLSAWGFAPSLTGRSGRASADLRWSGGLDGDVFARLNGKAQVAIQDGQLVNVQPGAGRVLGLMSVAALPRRLLLDFTDLTDKGFAFDTITGDFEFRDGNAYTKNLLLKGPAAEIGIAGRTGLGARDYEQTAMVTGHFGGPIAAAGALAAGPAVGAALLLFSKVFDGPLSGIARGYYRITGSWDQPKVERIDAAAAREAGSGQVAKDADGEPPG